MVLIRLLVANILGLGVLFSSSMALASDCPSGPYLYYAEITEVYDGDTVTADIDLGFHTWRRDEKLRLHGINAPEVRGAEREQGVISRDWLRAKILNKRILIQTIKVKNKLRGKYGRYIAVLYLKQGNDCFNINNELVRLGYAIFSSY